MVRHVMRSFPGFHAGFAVEKAARASQVCSVVGTVQARWATHAMRGTRRGAPMTWSSRVRANATSTESAEKATKATTATSKTAADATLGSAKGGATGATTEEAQAATMAFSKVRFVHVASVTLGVGSLCFAVAASTTPVPIHVDPTLPAPARAADYVKKVWKGHTEADKSPLLPPLPPDRKWMYTIVLELEDVLVTWEWLPRESRYRLRKRPGADGLIKKLCQFCEVVLFSRSSYVL